MHGVGDVGGRHGRHARGLAALLSITLAPALRDTLIRGKIFSERRHPVSRFIIALYKPFVYVALRRPKSTVLIGALAIASAFPLAMRLGHEFMPPLNEGDVLYMPITFPNIAIEEAKRSLQVMDRVLKTFPEVESVFGKIGRAETPTDSAPLTMVETTVRLRPREQWRRVMKPRWYSHWAPGWLRKGLRPIWPEDDAISWDELTAEMNRKLQVPGWTNAWTMPIKTRIDMLTTGIRTPIGIKVLGTDLEEIEQIGTALERLITPISGTRSVLYERNLGGLYVDIIPDRKALARYGLRVGDVERVIEGAIGGVPIGVTVEGRNRFTINVRYPRDLRGDIDALRRVLVPLPAEAPSGEGGAGGMDMGKQGNLVPGLDQRRALYAQAMPGMEGARGGAAGAGGSRSRLPDARTMSDVPGMGGMGALPMPSEPMAPAMGAASSRPASPPGGGRRGFIPLGQIADIRVAGGPPMVRDEDGLLVGYVYVDIDQGKRDIGGYVGEAKEVVRKAAASGDFTLPAGTFLKWTGQYELLEEMIARMKIVVPVTLMIIVLLLFLHFKNVVEVLIVLLSIPFALVGTVWLLWLLDYRVSTAVWVGVIALVGLAAQTGIVMIVYIDNAYERRRRAGKVRDLDDIIWAHMEGTVMRVRPKLMTVGTMLFGLVPLLWATGSGADVMKRIAAPMVGGLITSAFLTLEIIPVIYTYWRFEQLLWERLASLDPARLARLKILAGTQAFGWTLLAATGASLIYVTPPRAALAAALALAATAIVIGAAAYATLRPAAKRAVWPAT